MLLTFRFHFQRRSRARVFFHFISFFDTLGLLVFLISFWDSLSLFGFYDANLLLLWIEIFLFKQTPTRWSNSARRSWKIRLELGSVWAEHKTKIISWSSIASAQSKAISHFLLASNVKSTNAISMSGEVELLCVVAANNRASDLRTWRRISHNRLVPRRHSRCATELDDRVSKSILSTCESARKSFQFFHFSYDSAELCATSCRCIFSCFLSFSLFGCCLTVVLQMASESYVIFSSFFCWSVILSHARIFFPQLNI